MVYSRYATFTALAWRPGGGGVLRDCTVHSATEGREGCRSILYCIARLSCLSRDGCEREWDTVQYSTDGKTRLRAG